MDLGRGGVSKSRNFGDDQMRTGNKNFRRTSAQITKSLISCEVSIPEHKVYEDFFSLCFFAPFQQMDALVITCSSAHIREWLGRALKRLSCFIIWILTKLSECESY